MALRRSHLTPGRKSSSPAKKLAKQAVEDNCGGASSAFTTFNSEMMDAINAALDSKLDQLATRIEAMVSSKIAELETKFQSVQDEVQQLKEDVNDSINHVEDVLRQEINETWEYAVRNEQYSRKNNLRVLGLDEDETENLEEKFIKFVQDNLQEDIVSDHIEIIHRIGAKKLAAGVIKGHKYAVNRDQ